MHLFITIILGIFVWISVLFLAIWIEIRTRCDFGFKLRKNNCHNYWTFKTYISRIHHLFFSPNASFHFNCLGMIVNNVWPFFQFGLKIGFQFLNAISSTQLVDLECKEMQLCNLSLKNCKIGKLSLLNS
jgi:hypothetical protein